MPVFSYVVVNRSKAFSSMWIGTLLQAAAMKGEIRSPLTWRNNLWNKYSIIKINRSSIPRLAQTEKGGKGWPFPGTRQPHAPRGCLADEDVFADTSDGTDNMTPMTLPTCSSSAPLGLRGRRWLHSASGANKRQKFGKTPAGSGNIYDTQINSRNCSRRKV